MSRGRGANDIGEWHERTTLRPKFLLGPFPDRSCGNDTVLLCLCVRCIFVGSYWLGDSCFCGRRDFWNFVFKSAIDDEAGSAITALSQAE